MIPTILTARLAGRITPAEAAEVSMRAHQLVGVHTRRTLLGPVCEARCSCGTTLVRPDADLAYDALDVYVEHGLDAVDCITAQLVAPNWLDQLLVATAALTPDAWRLDGLDRQLADWAALGDVR